MYFIKCYPLLVFSVSAKSEAIAKTPPAAKTTYGRRRFSYPKETASFL